MSANTKIQWCHHTYNPWRGCRKVAAECANCYITTTNPFRTTGQKHGPVRVRAGAATLREPHAWNLAALKAYDEANPWTDTSPTLKAVERPRVFCLSLGDWLDDENVPIEWLAELLATIHATPHLDWLLLTKRPGNWMDRLEAVYSTLGSDRDAFRQWLNGWLYSVNYEPSQRGGNVPANVWIGVSAGADQAAALAIPARIHFLSCEPMLQPMDETHAAKFQWIIFGGESGSKARACNVNWIRRGLEFCRMHGVAPFVKQLGSVACHAPLEADLSQVTFSDRTWREGADDRLIQIRDKKGGDPAEWPEDLRVREFPSVASVQSVVH